MIMMMLRRLSNGLDSQAGEENYQVHHCDRREGSKGEAPEKKNATRRKGEPAREGLEIFIILILSRFDKRILLGGRGLP